MKSLKIGLVGNPNSGKSTLFNELTGGHQHVGNWPGVTVEKKEGRFQLRDYEVSVVDLPGTYSLTAHSADERIARDFIVREKPDRVVVIVDASNLERNLYLVTQLLELGANVILDLNMMDQVKNRGMMVDTEKFSKVFGVPVVETVANKGEGIEGLKEGIVEGSRREKNLFKIDYGQDIEMEIGRLEKQVRLPGYPSRWAAIKLLEGDREALETTMKEGKSIESQAMECRKRLEEHLGYDLETALVERRYEFLSGLVKESTSRRFDLMERLEISDRIDRILVNRYLGIPIFLGMMWLVAILVNPLMSCSARLPIYTLFAGAFFAEHQGWVVFSLYLLGIILAIFVARTFKSLFFRGEVSPLIMELPPYRLPTPKGVFIHMWERGSLFLKKAGTIILAGVVLIWLLASLP